MPTLTALTPNMNLKRPIFATLFIAACALSTWASGQNGLNLGASTGSTGPVSAVVTTNEVRAELMAWAPEGVGAGKPVWLGLQLAHQPEWHTYWKNPGD